MAGSAKESLLDVSADDDGLDGFVSGSSASARGGGSDDGAGSSAVAGSGDGDAEQQPQAGAGAGAGEEEDWRQELWSEFHAVEDQCTIAAQMMDAMVEEKITSIPDLLFDIVTFLDQCRPRILKLTQEGSIGELDEGSFAKALEINDCVCSLLKKFISIETALAEQERQAQAARQEQLLQQQRDARPRPMSAAEAAEALANSTKPRPPAPPHESGWVVCYTDQGHAYYYNRQANTSQWERPAALGSETTRPPADSGAASASASAAVASAAAAAGAGASPSAESAPARAVAVRVLSATSPQQTRDDDDASPTIDRFDSGPVLAADDAPPPFLPPPAYEDDEGEAPPTYSAAVSPGGVVASPAADAFTLDDL